ncbi:MAG: hypothetical protein V4651_03620 [Bacteroidota bacterium]
MIYNRKKYISVLLGLLLCLIVGGYLFFKTASWFVSSIDGDKSDGFTKLMFDYYYSENDATLWIKNPKFDTYKSVVTTKIDSLNFDEKNIVGYSETKYFNIDISTGRMQYVGTRDDLIQMVSKVPYGTLFDLPGIESGSY